MSYMEEKVLFVSVSSFPLPPSPYQKQKQLLVNQQLTSKKQIQLTETGTGTETP